MRVINKVCVYGASSATVAPVYYEKARELGSLLADCGIDLMTGGGNEGLMAAVQEGARSHGGKTIGVIPEFMVNNGWGDPCVTEQIITKTMHERKAYLAAMSDAAIALPGGVGTFEELTEIITWKMLGIYKNPVVILNTNSYYDTLLAALRHAETEKFLNPEIRLYMVARTPEQVLDFIYDTPDWRPKVSKK